MANRSFENNDFWVRVDEAIRKSGKTKIQLGEEMGVDRK